MHGLKKIKEMTAKHIVSEIEELDESMIERRMDVELVDLTFRMEDFEDHDAYWEVVEEMKEIYKNEFVHGPYCDHSLSKNPDYFETVTYQQGAGVSFPSGAGGKLSGGEVVRYCTQCGCVVDILQEASATGAGGWPSISDFL